jgi:hypothetical protein
MGETPMQRRKDDHEDSARRRRRNRASDVLGVRRRHRQGDEQAPFARKSQTIEVKADDLTSLDAKDLTFVHVKDDSGKELMAQAVDTDFDERPPPRHRHLPSRLQGPKREQDRSPSRPGRSRCSGRGLQGVRAVQPRAVRRLTQWENDRVAHRTYGAGLRTWKGER